jgi:hypothetical protein
MIDGYTRQNHLQAQTYEADQLEKRLASMQTRAAEQAIQLQANIQRVLDSYHATPSPAPLPSNHITPLPSSVSSLYPNEPTIPSDMYRSSLPSLLPLNGSPVRSSLPPIHPTSADDITDPPHLPSSSRVLDHDAMYARARLLFSQRLGLEHAPVHNIDTHIPSKSVASSTTASTTSQGVPVRSLSPTSQLREDIARRIGDIERDPNMAAAIDDVRRQALLAPPISNVVRGNDAQKNKLAIRRHDNKRATNDNDATPSEVAWDPAANTRARASRAAAIRLAAAALPEARSVGLPNEAVVNKLRSSMPPSSPPPSNIGGSAGTAAAAAAAAASVPPRKWAYRKAGSGVFDRSFLHPQPNLPPTTDHHISLPSSTSAPASIGDARKPVATMSNPSTSSTTPGTTIIYNCCAAATLSSHMDHITCPIHGIAHSTPIASSKSRRRSSSNDNDSKRSSSHRASRRSTVRPIELLHVHTKPVPASPPPPVRQLFLDEEEKRMEALRQRERHDDERRRQRRDEDDKEDELRRRRMREAWIKEQEEWKDAVDKRRQLHGHYLHSVLSPISNDMNLLCMI